MSELTERELEEKYRLYLRTMTAERRDVFNNTFSLKEKQIFLETLDEFFNVLYKQQKKIRIEDIKDDVNWIYKSIGYKPPKHIYIRPSLDATANTIKQHYKYAEPDDIIFNGYTGLIWEANVGNFVIFSKLGYFSNKDFDRYKNFLLKGVFDYIAFPDACFITRCPKVKFDDQGRPHSTNGPALEWADHRGDVFFIHGVRFDDPKLYWKIVKRELPAKQVINLPNVSMREVAIRLYGYEKLLKELNAKCIDKVTLKQGPPLGRSATYYLFTINLNDDFSEGHERRRSLPAKFLKVVDASTEKSYLIRVRPNITTIHEAIPSTFRVSPEEYWKALEYET